MLVEIVILYCFFFIIEILIFDTLVCVMYIWSWGLVLGRDLGGDSASLLPQPPSLQNEPVIRF